MANYPTSLDALANPLATDPTTSLTVPHAMQHATVNDILEALEAKLGIGTTGPSVANRILGSDSPGVTSWRQLVNADVSAAAALAYSKLNLADSLVNADVAALAAIAYSKLNLTGAILATDIGIGQVNKTALHYVLPTDVNGVTLNTSVWTNIIASQTYVIENANSLIEVYVHGVVHVTTAGTANNFVASRLLVQGATSYAPLGGGIIPVASGFVNALQGAGMVPITNTGAGSFTIQVQAQCSTTALMYCRAASFGGLEGIEITVMERKR